MYYLSFKVSIWRLLMQPIMLILDVDKHESVSVFSKAVVHFLPHHRITPITSHPIPIPTIPVHNSFITPSQMCTYIYSKEQL